MLHGINVAFAIVTTSGRIRLLRRPSEFSISHARASRRGVKKPKRTTSAVSACDRRSDRVRSLLRPRARPRTRRESNIRTCEQEKRIETGMSVGIFLRFPLAGPEIKFLITRVSPSCACRLRRGTTP